MHPEVRILRHDSLAIKKYSPAIVRTPIDSFSGCGEKVSMESDAKDRTSCKVPDGARKDNKKDRKAA